MKAKVRKRTKKKEKSSEASSRVIKKKPKIAVRTIICSHSMVQKY